MILVTDRNPSSGNTIKKKVWIQASPEVVYQALTQSKDLERWFCDKASCDPREEGELIAQWFGNKERRKGVAVIRRLVPHKAMELLWVDDGCGVQPQAPGHTLSYEIRSKSGMTELLMVDRDDAPSDEETCAFLDQGWNSVLLELKDFCENRERSERKSAENAY